MNRLINTIDFPRKVDFDSFNFMWTGDEKVITENCKKILHRLLVSADM